MSVEQVTSASNPLIKRARKLRRRKQREAEGAFLVEGIAPVWQAVEHGVTIDALFYSPDLLTSPGALDLVARLEGSARVVEVTDRAFETLSDREHPVGIAAIARAATLRLRDLEVGADSVFVALDEIGNPGNLGTIVRSVDGAGGSGVIVSGDSTDVWHPTAIKASMGTVFGIPLCVTDAIEDVLTWAGDVGLQTVTTSAHAEADHFEAHLKRPCLLVFGSEASGLRPGVLERGDVAVRIPMSGTATSLNLSVAVGVLLYEVMRPR
ncbi:MAG: TrmH family RNA methyltransferase [Actinomycetota bacterium]